MRHPLVGGLLAKGWDRRSLTLYAACGKSLTRQAPSGGQDLGLFLGHLPQLLGIRPLSPRLRRAPGGPQEPSRRATQVNQMAQLSECIVLI